MLADHNPEADALKSLDALPVASKFNIEFDGEPTFSYELWGYHQSGRITMGDETHVFNNVSTPESMQVSDYEDQWREAAQQIVSGVDRTAFVTNDGGGGWAAAFSGRWLMWRDGEKVYAAWDDSTVEATSNFGAYEHIESLESRCSRGTAHISALSLQAVKNFLGPARVTPSTHSAEPIAAVVSQQDIQTPWFTCGEEGPASAIRQLRNDPATQRKLFLAGCAWARRFWEGLGKGSRMSVETFERFADQEAAVDGFFKDILSQFLPFNSFAYLLQAHLANNATDSADPQAGFFLAMIDAEGAWRTALTYIDEPPDANRDIVMPARGVFSLSRGAYLDAADEFYFASGNSAAEHQAQCEILQDIFEDPSHPVALDRSWLAANEGAVTRLAATIYDERAFGRMPELAGALEKSGCNDQRILEHCRSQANHVRGCWVVDLLLAKDRLTFPLGARMPLAFRPD
jgi:hypothetical protein